MVGLQIKYHRIMDSRQHSLWDPWIGKYIDLRSSYSWVWRGKEKDKWGRNNVRNKGKRKGRERKGKGKKAGEEKSLITQCMQPLTRE